MRCRDCKFWGQEAGFRLPDGSEHSYGKPMFTKDGDYRQCLRLEKALDQDGPPFSGNSKLGTPAEFGCTLFQAGAPAEEPDVY